VTHLIAVKNDEKGKLMTFKIQKISPRPAKDVRLAFPAEIWDQVEELAKKEETEAAEVVRQAVAYAVRSASRKSRRPKVEE
jgi:hypothetical protein